MTPISAPASPPASASAPASPAPAPALAPASASAPASPASASAPALLRFNDLVIDLDRCDYPTLDFSKGYLEVRSVSLTHTEAGSDVGQVAALTHTEAGYDVGQAAASTHTEAGSDEEQAAASTYTEVGYDVGQATTPTHTEAGSDGGQAAASTQTKTSSARESQQHTKTQSANNHACLSCGKQFRTVWHLNRHTNTHLPEDKKHKPHKCTVCEKSFPLKDNLRIHLRTHTGEKPYECRFCPMRFTYLFDLKKHTKTHVGKPFACHCRAGFDTSKELKAHQATCNKSDNQASSSTSCSKK